jgi:hypothetical protein
LQKYRELQAERDNLLAEIIAIQAEHKALPDNCHNEKLRLLNYNIQLIARATALQKQIVARLLDPGSNESQQTSQHPRKQM